MNDEVNSIKKECRNRGYSVNKNRYSVITNSIDIASILYSACHGGNARTILLNNMNIYL